MQKYSDFSNEVLKRGSVKSYKINNSYGSQKIYRWLKKNKWLDIGQSITEREFGLIIKGINAALKRRLLEGHNIIFPQKMGIIELIKIPKKIKFIDGKLVTNLPIDWKRTLELWYKEPEEKKKKTILRKELKEIYIIHYNKKRATYSNKVYYKFTSSRSFKKELAAKIENNELDALMFKTEVE